MEQEYRLWSRQFVSVLAVEFGVSIGFFMLYSTIGIYAKSMTSIELYIGIVTGIFTFASLFTRLFSGGMMKRLSCKKVMLFGIGLSLLSYVGYSFADSLPVLIGVRMLNGLGYGFASAAMTTMISSMLPSARLLEGLGYSMMMITLCAAIGPTVGLTISQSNPERFWMVFLVAVLVTAVTLLLGCTIKDSPLPASEPVQSPQAGVPAGKKRLPYFTLAPVCILIISFFMSLIHTSVTACLNLYALEEAFGNMSLFFILFSCVNFLCRLFSGRIYRVFSERQVLVGINAILVLFCAGVFAAPNQYWIFVLAMPFGLVMGLYYPLVSAKILRSMPKSEQGTSNNLMLATQDIAGTIGAVFWAGLAGWLGGYRIVYLAAALFSVLLLVIVLVYPSILKCWLATASCVGLLFLAA